ncbi:MAG: Smr/MutS family protein [Azoarcus sp.]|jgi:DNA-nicking Smr family endonuclease|nr:Smr/MutS family protein [Azoarcus sp.]
MTRRPNPSHGRTEHAQDGNPFAALKVLKSRSTRPPLEKRGDERPAPTALAPDDRALFRHAVGGTLPLPGTGRAETSTPPPPPEPRQRRMDETIALGESFAIPFGYEDRLDIGEEAAFLRSGLRQSLLVDLRRGRWTPQGKIDLHGLNCKEAHQALTAFIAAALAQGKRCVRVIHGKGLGSPGGVPVLKQFSRAWLARREEILAFCQANPHEGGSGALLVLLRASGTKESDNRTV